jgi:hypothetical protein
MQERLTGLKEALAPQLAGESAWNRLNSRPADRPSRLAVATIILNTEIIIKSVEVCGFSSE